MTTDGIGAVHLTTHNWGRTAKFLQSLGFRLDFETDHSSGQLSNGDGPPVFVAEVPTQEPSMRLVLTVADEAQVRLDPSVEVVTPFADTHYGTREMVVRDPDGRTWTVQASAK